jgi:hypothetical protein
MCRTEMVWWLSATLVHHQIIDTLAPLLEESLTTGILGMRGLGNSTNVSLILQAQAIKGASPMETVAEA